MRKLSIFLTVLFVVAMLLPFQNQVQAQTQARFSKGLKTKHPIIVSGYRIIGHDENAVYARPRYPVRKLIKMNTSTMAMTEAEYTLKSSSGNRDLEFVVMLKGEIYLFSSLQDKKNKKHILYWQSVNKSTLRPATTLNKVVELSYSGESNRRPALFYYDVSPDESKLLITYVLLDKDGTMLRSGFSVFNEECNLLREENNISSGVEGKFSFTEFIVDNASNVYCTGVTTFDKKEMRQGAKNEAYVVICLEKERNFVPVKIELPASKEAVGQKIVVNNNSELYFIGTFTRSEMHNVVGLYSAKIDIEKQEIDNLVITDFNEAFLTKGLKDSEAKSITNKLRKGNDFENHRYYISKIEFLDNGSLVFAAEKGHVTYIRNSRDGSTTPIYHYGDIIIANFAQDASMNWIDKIPRELSLAVFPFGSFGFVTENNNVHVFYNLMKSSASILGIPPSKTKLIMYSLNADGESTWKEIHDSKSNKTIPRPWEAICHGDNNEIVMMGHKGTNSIVFTKIKTK